MASEAQLSPSTSWFRVTANGPLCLDFPRVRSCETCFPCRCPNQVESSPLPIPLCHLFLKLRWAAGNDGEMPMVCWESMLAICLVVEILLFRELCNDGFGLNLNLEPGSKVDFDFVVESLCQEYNRKSMKISMSKFAQEMEPVSVPQTCGSNRNASYRQLLLSQQPSESR